ncbi:hypothetical protein ACJRO7_015071, partial [Eucalyptus globulus]
MASDQENPSRVSRHLELAKYSMKRHAKLISAEVPSKTDLAILGTFQELRIPVANRSRDFAQVQDPTPCLLKRNDRQRALHITHLESASQHFCNLSKTMSTAKHDQPHNEAKSWNIWRKTPQQCISPFSELQ